MLDEKDLQAISQLLTQQRSDIMQEMTQEMDRRFAQQQSDIMQEMDGRFVQQKSEIMHEVNLLMESYFDPKFDHLADGLELLQEKAVSREELEEATDQLDMLKAVVKIHSREIDKLKRGDHIA